MPLARIAIPTHKLLAPHSRSCSRCLVAVLACALTACTAPQAEHSGFLTDYDNLTHVSIDQTVTSYVKSAVDAPNFTHFLLDPVVFLPGAGKADGVSSQEIAQMKAALTAAIIKSFKRRFEPAADPGPQVLRVRFAITDVKKSKPALNAVMAIILVPLSSGGATTEAEVLNSVTGERLIAIVGSTEGSLLKGEFEGFFSELGHAKLHFNQQVERAFELTLQSLGVPAMPLQNDHEAIHSPIQGDTTRVIERSPVARH